MNRYKITMISGKEHIIKSEDTESAIVEVMNHTKALRFTNNNNTVLISNHIESIEVINEL